MSYTFSKKPVRVVKGANEWRILRKLRAFLDAKEPALVYFLVQNWQSQEQSLTYKEIREAILAGVVTEKTFEQWYEDYAVFVANHLQPAWEEAMEAAAAELERRYPGFRFERYSDGVKQWAKTRSAEFVTAVTDTQIEGLRAVIGRAAIMEDMSVDQLSRAIRPMVGLTHPQATANLKYYETLIRNGTSEEKALDLSIRYGARQHRYRGYNIARTELAFAYNQGSYEGVKQAQEAGYMGEVVKVWSTADDERTCPWCGSLEGKTIALDEEFNIQTRLSSSDTPTIKMVPPAHPSCRCAVMYKEIAPPIQTINNTTTFIEQ